MFMLLLELYFFFFSSKRKDKQTIKYYFLCVLIVINNNQPILMIKALPDASGICDFRSFGYKLIHRERLIGFLPSVAVVGFLLDGLPLLNWVLVA